MTTVRSKIKEAAHALNERTDRTPDVGLILGSVSAYWRKKSNHLTVVPYGDIPHFPVSTVEGHAGRLVIGSLSGKQVIAMQGRFHDYEGYSQQDVTFPVYVMSALGVKTLFVTNAAGGAGTAIFTRGLDDYSGPPQSDGSQSPHRTATTTNWCPRFPDMSQAYAPFLRRSSPRERQRRLGIHLSSQAFTPGSAVRAS